MRRATIRHGKVAFLLGQRPEDPVRTCVHDRCRPDRLAPTSALMNMPTNDQARGLVLNRRSQRDAAEISFLRRVHRAMRWRVGYDHATVRTIGEQLFRLLFRKIVTPRAKRRDRYPTPQSIEVDFVDPRTDTVQDTRRGPAAAGFTKLIARFIIARHDDRRLVNVAENIDGKLDPTATCRKITGTDHDIDVRRPIDQPLRRGGVAVQVAKQQQLHEFVRPAEGDFSVRGSGSS